ncbi:hypothetical protein KPH14_009877 [Odynerus spinipes]|uniref:C2H2-type domain-containing protein n=1 Tax=Odynerus spinipes TaxID=1348599 RepID=A0AAD9VTZ6_9HYME|nr:hypothetical protein KPH14_009877 [Odynerus spinipes]
MEFLQNIGIGMRQISDPFFEETYKYCKVFQRKGVTAEDEEELCHDIMAEFSCPVRQCTAIFKTLVDFEMHYNSCHRYICSECKKIKSNPRLLEIHIQEKHDSFFKLLSEKQPMYQCYVSQCEMKFNNPYERREHCINIHKYPKNCRFDDISHYKAKQNSSNKMDTDIIDKKQEGKQNIELNKNQKIRTFNKTSKICSIEKSTATRPVMLPLASTNVSKNMSLIFVPRQVQMSYARTLTNNQNRERNVLEAECMSNVVNSLPE